MEAIRIENLRSLADTGAIEIKPITLLVGTNSSGKSTLLRAFPLLKQSIETATESPILWFGRYVDFGTIDTSINRLAPDKGISFQFTFNLPTFEDSQRELFETDLFTTLDKIQAKVKLKLIRSNRRQGSRVGGCEIEILDSKVELEFSETNSVTKFKINKFDAHSLKPTLRLSGSAFLIPSIVEPDERKSGRPIVYQPFQDSQNHYSSYRSRFRQNIFLDEVARELHGLIRDPLPKERSYSIAKSLQLGSRGTLLRHLAYRFADVWSVPLPSLSHDKYQNILDRLIANATPNILGIADEYIAQFVAGVTYMGPLRAIAARFYRAQDLSVREVDFRGENLAMFIRSLSEHEQESFSSFAQKHFNINVTGLDNGGHVEIVVSQGNSSSSINLADTGFGYSQMLPVIAQIWAAQRRANFYRRDIMPSLIAIEQPELHLHPAHQARLADMFVGAIRGSRSAGAHVRLMIETHSEAIINRMGELVYRKRVDPQDVQIAIFEQSRPGHTTVRFANYNQAGELENWPFGFFTPPLD